MTSEMYAVLRGKFRPAAPLMVLGIALLVGSAPSTRGAPAAGPVTERVNVAQSGEQANSTFSCGSFCELAAISADGRYVAFQSPASNLVVEDNTLTQDIFVRDRVNQTTELVNVSTAGAKANSTSSGSFNGFENGVSISADGRFVAFQSHGSNLVSGDTNNSKDIFVRDRFNGTTERVSIAQGGAEANGDSFNPAISADGQVVAFQSAATNLVAEDADGNGNNLFVRDRSKATTEMVSLGDASSSIRQSIGLVPALSADGRYVAFIGFSNLVGIGNTCCYDMYVRDRVLHTTQRISVASGPLLDPFFFQISIPFSAPSISADGRYVAYSENASFFGSPPIGLNVYDRVTGERDLIHIALNNARPNGDSGEPSISADGRFVAFRSDASNLINNDTNAVSDIFLRDRALHTTERVNIPQSGGQANAHSRWTAINADGRFVLFLSNASNLVTGDTNKITDIFVRDRATISDTQLSVSDASVKEGAFGGNKLQFTVSLSRKTKDDVSFRFSTEDVTARAGTDYSAIHGTGTIPAGSLSTIISIQLAGDFTSEPDETMRLNIDFPINATIGRGQAVGTILNDDSSLQTLTVGTFDLTPSTATVAVGDKVTYELAWTVPSGSWHDLNTIELRIGPQGSLLWLRFDEATRNLSLYNRAADKFEPSFAAGWPAVLSNGAAKLYLNESAVTAAGPLSPTVTLRLTLAFNAQAAGQDYPIELRATNDFGEFQDFAPAGTLTVTPGGAEHR